MLAFGSQKDPLYLKFLSRCVTYFLYLRKHSKLILSLLYLMIDSGLIINPNTSKEMDLSAIGRVGRNFLLNENEKGAEVCFNKLLNDSLNAKWARFFDWAHKKWVMLKN